MKGEWYTSGAGTHPLAVPSARCILIGQSSVSVPGAPWIQASRDPLGTNSYTSMRSSPSAQQPSRPTRFRCRAATKASASNLNSRAVWSGLHRRERGEEK